MTPFLPRPSGPLPEGASPPTYAALAHTLEQREAHARGARVLLAALRSGPTLNDLRSHWPEVAERQMPPEGVAWQCSGPSWGCEDVGDWEAMEAAQDQARQR